MNLGNQIWNIESPVKRNLIDLSSWYRISTSENTTVAYCQDKIESQLILATPDILAALKAAYFLLSEIKTIDISGAKAVLNYATKKAEGNEQ